MLRLIQKIALAMGLMGLAFALCLISFNGAARAQRFQGNGGAAGGGSTGGTGGPGGTGGTGGPGATGSPGATPALSPVPTSVATATAVAFDLSQGVNRTVTLNASGATFTCSNPTAGNTYKWKLIQGAGGSFTISSWCANMNWAGGSTGGGGAPTLSTTAASYDVIVCYYDGTYYSCDIEKGFVP